MGLTPSPRSDAIRCGGCGCATVTLRAVLHDERRDHFDRIEATCTQCGDVSMLVISAPVMSFEWGHKSNGVLCAGWNEKKPKGG